MRVRLCAMIRKPAPSITALIAPVKLRAVASGLMIEKVRSIGIGFFFKEENAGARIAAAYSEHAPARQGVTKVLAIERGSPTGPKTTAARDLTRGFPCPEDPAVVFIEAPLNPADRSPDTQAGCGEHIQQKPGETHDPQDDFRCRHRRRHRRRRAHPDRSFRRRRRQGRWWHGWRPSRGPRLLGRRLRRHRGDRTQLLALGARPRQGLRLLLMDRRTLS